MAHVTTYHVLPHEGGWAVKKEGAQRASSTHETKDEAQERAKQFAMNQAPGRVVLHDQEGRIVEHFAYSRSHGPKVPPRKGLMRLWDRLRARF